MITEIFVEGKRLDINADLSSLITFAIDDIKDFSSRQTAFSKTIVLPGTANNNDIFGNIFETGISNDYNPSIDNIGINFNPAKSARCLLFQDNLQTFKGTMRLLGIVKDKGRIEYEVALNGELTSLSVALSSKLLTDLDFSEYNLAYTAANISASWDNSPGSGVYFPLIDYGTYSTNKHDWSFRTFRPALYVKEYIDKMFSAAGFRYQCDLFNTDRFKKLVIPHNQKEVTKPKTGRLMFAVALSQRVIDVSDDILENDVTFTMVSGAIFSTDGKEFTYNGTTTIDASLSLFLSGTYRRTFPTSTKIIVRKNGTDFYYDGVPLNTTGTNPYTKSYDISISLAPGDRFSVHYSTTIGGFPFLDRVEIDTGSISISIDGVVTSPLDYGETIDVNYSIPENIRQVDFLVSIVELFNLYVYESKFDEKLIRITPFIDFYDTDASNAEDWTYKLDRDKPIKIKPLSEINSKIYDFNYKEDSDYFNELYKKRYNRGYGSHTFDSQFEFTSQTNKVELIFAPTPLAGYSGEDKVYSSIFKMNGADEELTDSVIRILQTRKMTGVESWKIMNGVSVVGTFTSYGYAGHFDNPDNPGNDLNFGVTQELFYVLAAGDLTKTQFNLYWSGYMAEITDKDSKLLTGRFYLTPKDIFELDFAKYVFLDGSLFRLNKITDYNATIPSDCEVQLLKVIQTAYSFPPGGGPGSGIEPYLLWEDGQIMMADDVEELMYE